MLGLGTVFLILEVKLPNRRYHWSFALKNVVPVEDLVLW